MSHDTKVGMMIVAQNALMANAALALMSVAQAQLTPADDVPALGRQAKAIDDALEAMQAALQAFGTVARS